MFVPTLALPHAPRYARVEGEVVARVLSRMVGDHHALTAALDDGFRDLERTQPALTRFLTDELSQVESPRLQALLYFLSVVLYLSFREAFGGRLCAVAPVEISQLTERLVADGELRSRGGSAAAYSEDAIAMGQPALVELLRAEIDRAIAGDPSSPAWRRVDALYETQLVLLLSLTQAVAPAA